MKNQFRINVLLMLSMVLVLALSSCKCKARQNGYTISGTAKGLDNTAPLFVSRKHTNGFAAITRQQAGRLLRVIRTNRRGG